MYAKRLCCSGRGASERGCSLSDQTTTGLHTLSQSERRMNVAAQQATAVALLCNVRYEHFARFLHDSPSCPSNPSKDNPQLQASPASCILHPARALISACCDGRTRISAQPDNSRVTNMTCHKPSTVVVNYCDSGSLPVVTILWSLFWGCRRRPLSGHLGPRHRCPAALGDTSKIQRSDL